MACVGTPLYQTALFKKSFFVFFDLICLCDLLFLFLYLSIMYDTCLERKGAKCARSLCGCIEQFTRKLRNRKKNMNSLCLCLFIYWISDDKNVNVFAISLLFILLALFTVSSLCASLQCHLIFVKTMWSSQQTMKANFVKILSVTLQNI